MNRALRILPAMVVLAWALPAAAGGYDTPMLYSARHMGMGGAAIGYVDDSSALFHNPAGLGRIQRANLLGDFSLLLGSIQGSPSASSLAPANIESNTTIAPFFLLGGAYRFNEYLTAGLAVYPVASAGATFEYPFAMTDFEDTTKLLFLEISPGLALTLPEQHLHFGVGYRINYVSLTRYQGPPDRSTPFIDLDLSGMSFAGFRAGVQWQPIQELSLGITYRHKTVTTVSNSEGTALLMAGRDIEADFTLPSKLGFGVRGDIGPSFGVALDVEYTFNSQNERTVISGTAPDGMTMITAPQYFTWDDSVTLRGGFEYEIPLEGGTSITPRIGYVLDGRTSTKKYPTAFGTPPAPTHVITAGVGFDGGPWEINLAYAYRFLPGTAQIDPDDLAMASRGDAECTLCSGPGSYDINLHGLYVDFSYDFEDPTSPDTSAAPQTAQSRRSPHQFF